MRNPLYYICASALLLAGCAQTIYAATEPQEAPSPQAEQAQQAPTPTPSKLATYPAYSRHGGTTNDDLACSLITVDDLTEVLGIANYAFLPEANIEEGGGLAYSCIYSAVGNPGANPLFTSYSSVDVTADVAAGRFADGRDRQEAPVLPIAGVGEEAYWVNLGHESVPPSLYARQANVGLLIAFAAPIDLIHQPDYEEVMRRALVGQINAAIAPTPTPVPFLLTPEYVPEEAASAPAGLDACNVIDPRSIEYTLNYPQSGLNLQTETFLIDPSGTSGACHVFYVLESGEKVTSMLMTYRLYDSATQASSALPYGQATLLPLLDRAVWVDASTLHIARGNVYFAFEVPRLLEAPYLQPDIEQTGADLARAFTYEYGVFEHTP